MEGETPEGVGEVVANPADSVNHPKEDGSVPDNEALRKALEIKGDLVADLRDRLVRGGVRVEDTAYLDACIPNSMVASILPRSTEIAKQSSDILRAAGGNSYVLVRHVSLDKLPPRPPSHGSIENGLWGSVGNLVKLALTRPDDFGGVDQITAGARMVYDYKRGGRVVMRFNKREIKERDVNSAIPPNTENVLAQLFRETDQGVAYETRKIIPRQIPDDMLREHDTILRTVARSAVT